MESSIQSFYSRTEHRPDINWERLSTVNDTLAFTGHETYWPIVETTVSWKLKTFSVYCLLSAAFIFYSIQQQHMQYIWGRELMVRWLSKICCMYYSLWRRKGASCQDGQQCQDIRRRRRRHLCAAEPMAPLPPLLFFLLLFLEIVIKKETRHDHWSKTLHQV